VTLSFILEVRR